MGGVFQNGATLNLCLVVVVIALHTSYYTVCYKNSEISFSC